MNNSKGTYRFLTTVTALMVFVSISLPAGLHAHGHMADFCPLEMSHDHAVPAPMPTEDCDMPAPSEQGESSNYGQDGSEGITNCDLGFACACSIDEAPVKTEAAPSTVKAKVILSVTTLDFTADLQPVETPREVLIPNLNSSPPPAFLVNSTFLN